MRKKRHREYFLSVSVNCAIDHFGDERLRRYTCSNRSTGTTNSVARFSPDGRGVNFLRMISRANSTRSSRMPIRNVTTPLRKKPPVDATRVMRYFSEVSACVMSSASWFLTMRMTIFIRYAPDVINVRSEFFEVLHGQGKNGRAAHGHGDRCRHGKRRTFERQ